MTEKGVRQLNRLQKMASRIMFDLLKIKVLLLKLLVSIVAQIKCHESSTGTDFICDQ